MAATFNLAIGVTRVQRKTPALFLAPLITMLFHCPLLAQTSNTNGETSLSLVRDAIANEVKLIQYEGNYLRYRIHTKDRKGDQVRDVLESKDGTIARLVLRDGRALTSDENIAEQQRLQEMLDSPSAFQKHIQKDRNGKKMASDLITLLPDAMLFTYSPGQPQRHGRVTTQPAEVVIDFKPNPHWSPPTMVSQALTGIQGRCWIEEVTHHLTRLEVTVFQPVNFGFGVFARIYPGGTIAIEQQAVGSSRWMVDRFAEHVTLRALMVRTVNENADLFASDFLPVLPMSYQQAIHLLLSASPVGGGTNGAASSR